MDALLVVLPQLLGTVCKPRFTPAGCDQEEACWEGRLLVSYYFKFIKLSLIGSFIAPKYFAAVNWLIISSASIYSE